MKTRLTEKLAKFESFQAEPRDSHNFHISAGCYRTDVYSNLIERNLAAIYGGAIIVIGTDEAKRSHQNSRGNYLLSSSNFITALKYEWCRLMWQFDLEENFVLTSGEFLFYCRLEFVNLVGALQ